MLLAFAVFAGLFAGVLRALYGRRPLRPPALRISWLVFVAFLIQFLAFSLPETRALIPDGGAALGLVFSQALLLLFVWYNREQPGAWMLGLGVAMNLLVIAANGGFMPVRPEAVSRLVPGAAGTWDVGSRLWMGKDIVLAAGATHFSWLADRFFLPSWSPYQAVFSLGDVFVAAGAFWLLWESGSACNRPARTAEERELKSITEAGSTGV